MKRKLKWRIESTRSEIIHDDDDLLVLNKPPRLLVLPDRYIKTLANLYTILMEELGKVFVVHRIDRETSGVILFAKNAEAHTDLNKQFEERRVDKTYQAIVVGSPNQDEGLIDLPLAEDRRDVGLVSVDRRNGKEAVTTFKVLERFSGYAFLELKPKTGRMHQIRVHLQSIGLPILADGSYGTGRGFFLSDVKASFRVEGEEKPLLDRTALHAAGITLVHPSTRALVTFSAPLPKDMVSVLRYLRKFRKWEQSSF